MCAKMRLETRTKRCISHRVVKVPHESLKLHFAESPRALFGLITGAVWATLRLGIDTTGASLRCLINLE